MGKEGSKGEERIRRKRDIGKHGAEEDEGRDSSQSRWKMDS